MGKKALILMTLWSQLVLGYEVPVFPYAPAAGLPGSTAVSKDDPQIEGWAIKVDSVRFGEDVSEEWRELDQALGAATAISEGVLVLGRGGEVVMSFEGSLRDGEGYDFAVFENALDDTFLELAFVEVSSDGVHFVRFPNYSVTGNPVGAFGNLQPEYVHGLAGKYRIGFGTPFDLAILRSAYTAALAGDGGFSDEYRTHLVEQYGFLDFEDIRFVKIIDIPGDGRVKDAEGFSIYDPYPTVITSGFDLDAIAVLNRGLSGAISFEEWSVNYDLAPLADTDFDKDGWSQYLEYIFDSDPRSDRSRPTISLSFEGNHLVLEYSRRVQFRDSISILISSNLKDWIPWDGERDIRPDPSNPTDEFVIEKLRIPIEESAGRMFARLIGP